MTKRKEKPVYMKKKKGAACARSKAQRRQLFTKEQSSTAESLKGDRAVATAI
jgi:hypothetical protein